MVNFGPPEFVRVTDCVWLLPTETLPKLTFEGFTVSCRVAPDACKVSARIVAKKKNKRSPHETPLHLEPKFFTARPLVPLELRGGGCEAVASRSHDSMSGMLYQGAATSVCGR